MQRHARVMDKSYKTAIDILNGARRQTRPNAKQVFNELQQMPSTNGEPQIKGTPSILGMRQWLQRIGHSPSDIAHLNIVHVAGTKGKGSTCAFVDSFLRAHGSRTGFPAKVGLYTSPHLACPEERIRINFAPLSQELFTKYVWEVSDKLAESQQIDNESTPRYLQLLALVAFHAFISEGIQAAVFETHHGGEFDATNVIEKPVATVVTSLGMDHVLQLGPTIENIAWHKSGIFKPKTLAFTPDQEPSALAMLKDRAKEKSADLSVIEHDSALPAGHIKLKPDVQRTNCSVALAAARAWVRTVSSGNDSELSDADVRNGLEQFSWPGRFQIVSQSDATDTDTADSRAILDSTQWFLDSAHNAMSIVQAGRWFVETSVQTQGPEVGPRVLLFTQLSDQREGKDVLRILADELRHHDIRHVIFTTYEIGAGVQTVVKEPQTDLSIIDSFQQMWKEISPHSETSFKPTIAEAVDAAKAIASTHRYAQVLVTGSQHLVGGALLLLKPQLFGLNTPSAIQQKSS